MQLDLRFGLYRILGNDLPPRHGTEQTLMNTQWMLENEFDPENTEKVFILNRIFNPEKLENLKRLLTDAKKEYIELPFEIEKFRALKTDLDRIKYVTNVNPARNYCLLDGARRNFDVILPLDGACYFPRQGWYAFEEVVWSMPDVGYFAIPMARVGTLQEALIDGVPQLRERYVIGDRAVYGMREPQLAFTKHADRTFNETLPYGRVDKVELLWKLGIAGAWDNWEPQIRKLALKEASKWWGTVPMCGWCIRLPAHSLRDGDILDRGHARSLALSALPQLVQRFYS